MIDYTNPRLVWPVRSIAPLLLFFKRPEKFFLVFGCLLVVIYLYAVSPITTYFHGTERFMQVVNYASYLTGTPGQIPVSFLKMIKESAPGKLRSKYGAQAKIWDKKLRRHMYLSGDTRVLPVPRGETRWQRYKRLQAIPLKPQDTVPFITRGEPAFYPVIGFIPYIIPTALGIWAGMAPVNIMYMAMLTNGLLSVALGYWLIRLMPVMRWCYVFLLLMPSLFVMRVVPMPDAICFELCLLMLAAVLHLRQNPHLLTGYERISLCGLAVCVGMIKVAYFLLPAVSLLIPNQCFRSSRQKLQFAGLLLFSSIAASVAWNAYVVYANNTGAPMTVISKGHGWQPVYAAIINPLNSLKLMFEMLTHWANYNWWLHNLFFWPYRKYFESLVLIATLLILGMVLLPYKDRLGIIGPRERIICGLTFVAVFSVIFIAKSMTTPLGTGLQGRYFGPILPLLLGAFYKPVRLAQWQGGGVPLVLVIAAFIIWIEMHRIMFSMLRII